MSSTPSFVATVKTPAASFANADGTSFKTVLTPGSGGTRIDSIFATTTDPTTASVLQLAVQVSGVDYVIGEVSIPIGAGTNGSAKSVAVLNPTDLPALAYTEAGALFLASGALLRAKVKTAVAGSYVVALVCIAADY